MNEEQKELLDRYIAQFAVENNRKLHDDGVTKAIELFDEYAHRWLSDSNAPIQDMAKGLDCDEIENV